MTEADRLALEAYYDGELSGFSAWRLERRLRRSPELREELDQLQQFSSLVSDSDSDEAPSALGTWQTIAGALAAIDAQVEAEERAGALVRPGPGARDRRTRSGWQPGWGTAVAGMAAAAAIALVIALGTGPSSRPAATTPIAAAGAVRYLDTSGRSVMVIEEVQEDLTILWMMDEA